MPANYDQPRDVVKRTRFFDGQFLKDQDFIDDQKYHIDRQRRPHRLLRVSGICEGLTVVVDANQVKVTPGTALDSQGRLIVLSDPATVDLQNQTDALDIFISYGNEESDLTQPGNDRSASVPATPSSGSATPSTGQGTSATPTPSSGATPQGAAGATRWLEKPQIEAVKTRSALKGENPVWLGRVTVTVSGTNRTVTLTTLTEREYSGIYLPSGANAFEGPVLRSGGNPNPKLAVLTGDLRIRGTTADNTAASLNVTNANPASPSLLYVRNDGNVGIGTTTPAAKLAINGGLHVGGDSDPGDNNLLVDGTLAVTGSSILSGTLAVTGNSTLGGNLRVNTGDLVISKPASQSNTPGQVVGQISFVGYNRTVNSASIVAQSPNWDDQSHLVFSTSSSGTGATEKLRITHDGNVGIGTPTNTTTPVAKLAINGGLHVGGDSDPGDNNLLVDGTLAVTGNSTLTGSLTVNNAVSLKGSASTTGLSVDASGDVTMGGTLNFGATVRQMISLWKSGNSNYGIGIQSGTQYFRTDANFAWYKGGAHADGELSPGSIGSTNGTVQMFIKDGNVGIGTTPPATTTPVAKLAINGGLHVGGDSDPGDNNLLVDGTLAVTGNSTLTGNLTVNNTVSLKGSATGVGLRVDANGNVGIGITSSPRSALDTGTGVMTGAANDYQKAQFTMSGGGTVSWGGIGGRLKWTARFIAISMERSTTFSGGHVNINQPSTNIPSAQVYDGVARSATADGVVLNGWEALYAVHSPGGDQSAVSFQIVRYTNVFIAPSNWILVAVVNEDDRTIKLGTGTILAANSSSTMGSPIPTGTIVMWSGAANTIPAGWALCNGQNGTPDLRSRFIVGAGDTTYAPGNSGEADTHVHGIQVPNGYFNTDNAGSHDHKLPDAWYQRSDAVRGGLADKFLALDTGGGNPDIVNVQSAGNHSHAISIAYGQFNSASSSANRPRWYALCFIIKL